MKGFLATICMRDGSPDLVGLCFLVLVGIAVQLFSKENDKCPAKWMLEKWEPLTCIEIQHKEQLSQLVFNMHVPDFRLALIWHTLTHSSSRLDERKYN